MTTIIPKVYGLNKLFLIDTVYFNTEVALPKFKKLYIGAFANMESGVVDELGTMKLTLQFGGTDIEFYGGPSDNSAYGSPLAIYEPLDSSFIPNRVAVKFEIWNDAGGVENYAGRVMLSIMYEF